MAASLGMGYAVQNFMIPVLKNNPQKNMHLKLVFFTYVIGILVYTFISYSCFGTFILIQESLTDILFRIQKPSKTILKILMGLLLGRSC